MRGGWGKLMLDALENAMGKDELYGNDTTGEQDIKRKLEKEEQKQNDINQRRITAQLLMDANRQKPNASVIPPLPRNISSMIDDFMPKPNKATLPDYEFDRLNYGKVGEFVIVTVMSSPNHTFTTPDGRYTFIGQEISEDRPGIDHRDYYFSLTVIDNSNGARDSIKKIT